jgi:hypothetical protein
VAAPVLSAAAELASTRVHRQVRRLSDAMVGYACVPEVRDFRERAGMLGLTG